MSGNVETDGSGADSSTPPLSEDSLRKIKRKSDKSKLLKCALKMNVSMTTQQAKEILWRQAWAGHAVDLEVKLKEGSIFDVKIFFNTEEERRQKRTHINLHGMQALLDGGRVYTRTERAKFADDGSKKSTGSSGKINKMRKYAGPNGQPQRNIFYGTGCCPYGCGKEVQESEVDAHFQTCKNAIKYLTTKLVYDNSEKRKSERPSLFVAYEPGAAGSEDENPIGFRYGRGPMVISKREP